MDRIVLPGLRSFCASRRSEVSMGRWPMSLITASLPAVERERDPTIKDKQWQAVKHPRRADFPQWKSCLTTFAIANHNTSSFLSAITWQNMTSTFNLVASSNATKGKIQTLPRASANTSSRLWRLKASHPLGQRQLKKTVLARWSCWTTPLNRWFIRWFWITTHFCPTSM